MIFYIDQLAKVVPRAGLELAHGMLPKGVKRSVEQLIGSGEILKHTYQRQPEILGFSV